MMRKNIFFLFYLFYFSLAGCSPISFSTKGKGSLNPNKDWRDYSISEECEDQPENCVFEKEEDSPFLTARYEKRPGYLTEVFRISSRDDLEILFVVDSSGSMDDNLKNTGENMRSVLSYIQDKNWRMAFTTADHGDHLDSEEMMTMNMQSWRDYQGDLPHFGKLMKLEKNRQLLPLFILDPYVSEYERIFEDTLTKKSNFCNLPPYCQGYNEQPLRALKAVINRYKTDEENRQFFKPNADTAVIIITDEDERKEDFRRATTAEHVIQTYRRVFRGMEKRLFGFSISIQDEDCLAKERGGNLGWSGGADYGRIVGRLAELTGGKNISLCSEDYGLVLAEISQNTRALAQSPTLSKIFYIPDTVRVSLDPEQPHISWKLYGRKLVFSGDVAPDTEVTVSYQYE